MSLRRRSKAAFAVRNKRGSNVVIESLGMRQQVNEGGSGECRRSEKGEA